MNKIISATAVAACATVIGALTPSSANAVPPPPPVNIGEVLTGCENGTTGYVINPDQSTTEFGAVPGSQEQLTNHGAGVYRFFTNQPAALPAYGPGMSADRSAPFATEGVDGAIVNFDDGASMRFFNDRAGGFQFNVPSAYSGFHVYYKCGNGRS